MLLAAASPACDRQAADRGSNALAPPVAPQPNELDRLRALGYVDFADEIVDPEESVVPVYDPVRSAPGFNLFVSRSLGRAELIDPGGRVIRAWQNRLSTNWSNAELTQDGDLLVQGLYLGRSHLFRMSWDGQVIWKRAVGAHHDVEVRPDGLLAALVQRGRRIPRIDPESVTLDNGIALLRPDGQLLREYSLYDMLSAAPDVFVFQRVASSKRKVDLFHSNSIEFMRHSDLEARHAIYAAHNAIVSIRHQDAIAIFDLEAEKVVWTWGQGEISGPHDATVLESGNILLFDNGLGRGWSRVIELDPLAKTIVWEYRAPNPTDFYTAGRGSNQRLPNGNTLIANSDRGEAFEVTREGEVVWRFLNPNSNRRGQRATIVRTKRYSEAFIAEAERRAARGSE